MPTVPRILERRAHLVDMLIRKNPDVVSYNVGSADTIDNAFAGVTSMFQVYEGRDFRSKTIRQKQWGLIDEKTKGTRFIYDPADYAGSGNIPLDAHTSYLAVIETSKAGVVRPQGPILVVPPPNYLTTSRPAVAVSGTAPNVAATASTVPPDGAMHFVLPRYSDGVRIHNTGGSDLLVSFDAGMPEFAVPSGEVEIISDAHISSVYVHVAGATTTFTMHFALVNGLQE